MFAFFKQFPEIIAVLSEKKDGSMRLLPKREDWLSENIENRKQYFEKVGLDGKKVIAAHLVHGNHVAIVDHDSPDYILETDGLVTIDPAVALAITVADCYPVYFYDEKKKMMGLTHIGWSGAVKNIVADTLGLMKKEGSDPLGIAVTLGPGICQKHYLIPPERAVLFENYPEAILKKEGQLFLDIKKIIYRQLKENGIVMISDSGECTSCLSEKYFSYRRDKPEKIEAMVAVIGLVS
ncbi:MAG: peptidoglycan editing factor PgeF [Candidatus Moranbacteria bacterium]|nr:peptidoglycan editing factor PgeF [Candidatus Moranbacteria bacterium]